MINIENKFKMEGYYSFRVINAITGEERDVSDIIAKDHKNLVLDSGLNALGKGSICGGCKVGTGSTPVSATQIDLTSTLANTTTIQTESSGRYTSAPYYLWGRRTYRFNQGAAAGNLTEVGVYGQSSSSLFSRALIVDTGGNPTTLTILSDEWLDITYELRIYQDLTDKTYNLTLLGTDHVVTIRPANITTNITYNTSAFFSNFLYYYTSNSCTHYNGVINIITSQPGGSSSSLTPTYPAYVDSSYSWAVILSSGLNEANISGGIVSTLIRTHKGDWQVGYSPAIAKDSFKTLVITISFSWGRYDT